jgi:hypothetical protein
MSRSLAMLSLLVLLAVPSRAAAAEPPVPEPASRSGPALALGLEYRHVWNKFYFYPSAYSETVSNTIAISGEAGWHYAVGERWWLGPGIGVSAGLGSADFWSSKQTGSGGASYGASAFRVEVFGEAGVDVNKELAVVARLGYGASFVGIDPAADTLSAGLVAIGAQYRLSPRLSLLGLLQFSFGPDGSTDAGITAYDPTLTDGSTTAVQVRLVYRP